MTVRGLRPEDHQAAAAMLAAFRVSLSALRGHERQADLAAASEELREFLDRGFPVFVAEQRDRLIGLLVCRVDGDTVWAECLYVAPEHRRCGVGRALYADAEALAASFGEPTVYNWVHPNNDAVIGLLRSRGYDVLNLIEVRKPYPGEMPRDRLCVGDHPYRY